MNMQTIPPLNAAAALKRFGLRPSKGLGQNFLQDSAALEKICEAAEITADDFVLEIGPGLGSLTRYLAASAREVLAVELDGEILPALAEILRPYKNARVIHADILKTKMSELVSAPNYIVAANIPYYITSAVIRHLLESDLQPRRIVLTIQKEVAERICATPGDLSLLALSAQVYGEPRLMAKIPAASFYPAPKVDSAILRIDMRPQPLIAKEALPRFFQLIKAGFGQKRKTLRNALAAGLHVSREEVESMLSAAGIDFMRRAETLNMDEWRLLCETPKQN